MSVVTEVGPNGNLLRTHDDVARKVTDHTVTPAAEKAYSPAEITEGDRRIQALKDINSRTATRAAVKAVITDLQAEKARCDAVIAKSNAQITGADTKDVARASKRIADAAIDLARLLRDIM